MKIQGQSYESVVDCVSLSNWKSYPNFHISTHKIDMSGIIKIIIFSRKGKNYLQFSYDQSDHPNDYPAHEPYKHSAYITFLSLLITILNLLVIIQSILKKLMIILIYIQTILMTILSIQRPTLHLSWASWWTFRSFWWPYYKSWQSYWPHRSMQDCTKVYKTKQG